MRNRTFPSTSLMLRTPYSKSANGSESRLLKLPHTPERFEQDLQRTSLRRPIVPTDRPSSFLDPRHR